VGIAEAELELEELDEPELEIDDEELEELELKGAAAPETELITEETALGLLRLGSIDEVVGELLPYKPASIDEVADETLLYKSEYVEDGDDETLAYKPEYVEDGDDELEPVKLRPVGAEPSNPFVKDPKLGAAAEEEEG
jgi:hypothetical protein